MRECMNGRMHVQCVHPSTHTWNTHLHTYAAHVGIHMCRPTLLSAEFNLDLSTGSPAR